ncbi:MAG: ABC-F family ATP-binding cassette domain-containing protein [Rhodospirillales bacterium]
MLHINDLTYRVGGRMLFNQATVVVPAGHRVGLVGRNGTGKSTLLKLIAGELSVDGGSVNVRPGARLGRMAQEAPDGPESLIDTVLAADLERARLLHEAETETDPMRIAEIHMRLADIGAHAAPARAARILAGLGFDHEAQQRPCSSFSGGWRMRVSLAAALFAEPDLLLLDEPSNHLDIEARLWLESYIKAYPYTLIMVSHDRDLLNASVEQIVHIDGGKLVSYSGGYDDFERMRRERVAGLSAAQVKQEAQRKHLQAFVDRFRAKASKATQAQSRLKMLARMQPVVALAEDEAVNFNFPTPPSLSPPLIVLEHASAGYTPGEPVLSKLDLRLDMDDRIALLGANGNGKSTLIRLLSDRLKPMTGALRKSGKLRVGYFAQHQAEELDLKGTPLGHMAKKMPNATPQKHRGQLGRFNFSGHKAEIEVAKLSGGEKTRLLFALMTVEAPHILLLDEPTNHLDMDAREALIEALNDYEGAVVLVSHDTHLVRLVADRLWLVQDGTCTSFEGDLDDYQRQLISERGGSERERAKAEKKAKKNARIEIVETVPVVDTVRLIGETERKEQRRIQAEKRQQIAPLRKAVADAETWVARMTKQVKAVQDKLADPKLYEGSADTVRATQMELGRAQAALAEAEAEWLNAQTQLDAVTQDAVA